MVSHRSAGSFWPPRADRKRNALSTPRLEGCLSIYNRFFGLVAQVRMCPEPSSNRRSRFISLTRKRSITNDVGHEKRCVLNVSTSMGWMLFAIPATETSYPIVKRVCGSLSRTPHRCAEAVIKLARLFITWLLYINWLCWGEGLRHNLLPPSDQ